MPTVSLRVFSILEVATIDARLTRMIVAGLHASVTLINIPLRLFSMIHIQGK